MASSHYRTLVASGLKGAPSSVYHSQRAAESRRTGKEHATPNSRHRWQFAKTIWKIRASSIRGFPRKSMRKSNRCFVAPRKPCLHKVCYILYLRFPWLNRTPTRLHHGDASPESRGRVRNVAPSSTDQSKDDWSLVRTHTCEPIRVIGEAECEYLQEEFWDCKDVSGVALGVHGVGP